MKELLDSCWGTLNHRYLHATEKAKYQNNHYIYYIIYIYFVFTLTFTYYRENVILKISAFLCMTYYPALFLREHFCMTWDLECRSYLIGKSSVTLVRISLKFDSHLLNYNPSGSHLNFLLNSFYFRKTSANCFSIDKRFVIVREGLWNNGEEQCKTLQVYGLSLST